MLTVTLPEHTPTSAATYGNYRIVGHATDSMYCNGWFVEPGGSLVLAYSQGTWVGISYEKCHHGFEQPWLEQYCAAHDEAKRDRG